MTSRAVQWATREVGAEVHTVAYSAAQLGVARHTVMDAVAYWGQALIEDLDRIGVTEAVRVDETKRLAARRRRPTRWVSAICDVARRIVIDVLNYRLRILLACGGCHWDLLGTHPLKREAGKPSRLLARLMGRGANCREPNEAAGHLYGHGADLARRAGRAGDPPDPARPQRVVHARGGRAAHCGPGDRAADHPGPLAQPRQRGGQHASGTLSRRRGLPVELGPAGRPSDSALDGRPATPDEP
jgi:hypothetical protein